MNTQDRLDILQKVAEYSYTFDGKDAEGWSKLFTVDGVWESIRGGDSEPTERLVGRDEIRSWAAQRHATIPNTYRSFHHQSGTVFDELTQDSARTRTMLILTGQDTSSSDPREGAPRVTITGTYHDDWQKTAEGWLFAKRVLVI